ncbi:MAG: hypothetical protein EOP51_28140, partial [Sphingobacteriales bacterium]
MKKTLLTLLLAMAFTSVFANLTTSKWRWRNNDGTEQNATWKAAQDVPIVINDQNPFRLRAEIYNDTGDSTKRIGRGLEYALSTGGPWYAINDVSPINAFVYAGDSYYITHNQATTKQLAASRFPVFAPGNIITGGENQGQFIKIDKSYEFEWALKATANALPNTIYYFRAQNTEGNNYPRLTTGDSFTAPTILLSNGGFETDQAVWTPTNSNGSAATFSANTAARQMHTGARAFKAMVTNRSTTNSVKLTHSAFI